MTTIKMALSYDPYFTFSVNCKTFHTNSHTSNFLFYFVSNRVAYIKYIQRDNDF